MWMALVASSFLAFLSAFLAFPTLRRVQRARQQQARCSAQRCDAGQRRKNRSISLVTPKSDLSPPSLAPSCLHPPLPVWVLYLQWRDLRLRAGPAQVPQYPGRRYTGTSYHTRGRFPKTVQACSPPASVHPIKYTGAYYAVAVHQSVEPAQLRLYVHSYTSPLLYTRVYSPQIIKTHPRSQDGSQQHQRFPRSQLPHTLTQRRGLTIHTLASPRTLTTGLTHPDALPLSFKCNYSREK